MIPSLCAFYMESFKQGRALAQLSFGEMSGEQFTQFDSNSQDLRN
jgi:hypothetical protein